MLGNKIVKNTCFLKIFSKIIQKLKTVLNYISLITVIRSIFWCGRPSILFIGEETMKKKIELITFVLLIIGTAWL